MKNHRGNTGRVLNYLKSNECIISIKSFELFGATRLSAIIYNLRKEYEIESVKRESVNRYGERVTFSEYKLIGEKK